MRKHRGSYRKWDIDNVVFVMKDSEIEHLIEASGHSKKLKGEIKALHMTIQEIMTTSNMSYQFKKMKRGERNE